MSASDNICRTCGARGPQLAQEYHQDVCPHAEVVPVGTPLAAQRFRDVVVSVPRKANMRSRPRVAISTDINSYVQVDADRLRWLVEVAGPKALLALEERHDG